MAEVQDKLGDYRRLGSAVGLNHVGLRLDRYLADQHPFLSRNQWRDRLSDGQLLVSGEKVRPAYRLRLGDALVFFHPKQAEPPVDANLYPLWKRGSVMAVFKPGNLPMHESGPYRFHTFSALLTKDIGPGWAAVHRLDRETSGIVLCAKTPLARKVLSDAFARQRIQKEYLAVAKGDIDNDAFWERRPIGSAPAGCSIRIKKWVNDEGLRAETFFEVLERKRGFCLLKATPKTGRTNQIRIHAAANGLPLVGDKLYHPDEDIFEEYFQNRGNTGRVVAATGFHRLCLHAQSLQFAHPDDGSICRVFSALPDDLAEFWAGL